MVILLERQSSSGLVSVINACDSDQHQEHLLSNLQELWLALDEVKEDLSRENIGNEAVIFIGLTCSGKSTMRLLLTGENDFADLEIKDDPPCIRDIGGTEIGDSSGYSCTSVPAIFQVQNVQNTSWIDTPGAKDNRGAFREIVGMHLLNHAVNLANQIKCLLFIEADAFKSGGNRDNLVKAFEYARQFINPDHLSSLKSVGLVVTKVNPSVDQVKFKKQVMRQLEMLKGQEEKGPLSDSNMVSLLNNIMETKNIFLVRYPDDSELLDYDADNTYSMEEFGACSEYKEMCNNFVSFCEGVECSEKLNQFTVTPSDSTRNKLIENIYPKLIEHISKEVSDILTNFENNISTQISICQLTRAKLSLLRNLTNAQKCIAAALQKTTTKNQNFIISPSIINIINISGTITTESMESLKRLIFSEKLLADLTATTQTYHVNTSSILELLSTFKPKLDKWHTDMKNSLTETDNKQVQSDKAELIDKIKAEVDIIKEKYKERQDSWTNERIHYGRAMKKLQAHLNAIKNLDDAALFSDIYRELNLVISDNHRKAFEQISLDYNHLIKLCGGHMDFPGPVAQMKDYLEDLNKSNNLKEWRLEMKPVADKAIANILEHIKNEILNKQFYANINSNTLNNKVVLLESLTKTVETYQAQMSSHQANSANILREIRLLCKQLQLTSILENGELMWSLEPLQYADMDEILSKSWNDGVLKLCNNMHSLVDWYKSLNIFLNDCEMYVSMKPVLKSLLLEGESSAQHDQAQLNEIKIPGQFEFAQKAVSLLSLAKYAKDRKIFQDVLDSSSKISYRMINNSTLLVMASGNVHFSDILTNYKLSLLPDKCPNNVIILAGKTVLVNHSLQIEDQISNLFIGGGKLESLKGKRIFLWGKNGQHVHERARDGKKPGEDGNIGRSGEDGGPGGNIFVVTNDQINCDKFLKIKSYGGEGGWGQDGGDGYCPINGHVTFVSLRHKLEKYFGEFNDLCNVICKKLELEEKEQLTNLKQYEAEKDEKILNVEICEQVERSWSIVIAVYTAIENCQVAGTEPVFQLPTEAHQHCFCKSPKIINKIDGAILPKEQMDKILSKDRFTRLKILTAPQHNPDESKQYSSEVIKFLANEQNKSEHVPLPMDRKFHPRERPIWCYFCNDVSNGCFPLSKDNGKISDSILCMMKGARNKMRDICKAYFGKDSLPRIPTMENISDSVKLMAKTTHEKLKNVDVGAGGKGGVGGRMGCPGIIKVFDSRGENISFEKKWCVMKHGRAAKHGREGLVGKHGKARGRGNRVRVRSGNDNKRGRSYSPRNNNEDIIMKSEDGILNPIMGTEEGTQVIIENDENSELDTSYDNSLTESFESHCDNTNPFMSPERDSSGHEYMESREDGNLGCMEDCKKDHGNPTRVTNEMISLLKSCLEELTSQKLVEERKLLISLLAPHDWAMKNIFSVQFFVDEFLSISQYCGSPLFTRDHLEEQITFQERLKKFQRANQLEGDKIIEFLLSSSVTKTAALLWKLEAKPVIMDLKNWLRNYQESCLAKLQELKLNDQSRDHLTKYYDEKISTVKAEMETNIPAKLEQIDDWFKNQKQELKEKVDGWITLIKVDSRYKRAQIIFEAIAKVISPRGPLISPHQYALAGCSAVASLVAAGIGAARISTPVPNSVKKNAVHDQKQCKTDIENMLTQQIKLIQKYNQEHLPVNINDQICLKLLEIQTTLENVQQQLAECMAPGLISKTPEIVEKKFLECLKNLEDIQTELFNFLDEKQKFHVKNQEKASQLFCLHLELRMADPDNQLYEKTKDTITKKCQSFFGIGDVTDVKYAKQRATTIDGKFVPLMDLLLNSIKSELEGDDSSLSVKWNMKDMIISVESYASSYFDQLPCQKGFELGFKKIKDLLKLYTSSWGKIVEYEEAKQINKFFLGVNFRIDVPQVGNGVDEELRRKLEEVEYLTQAELGLMEYKKVKTLFLQWAFPHVQRIHDSVKDKMNKVDGICNHGNVSKNEIIEGVQMCKDIISHFKKTYDDNQTEGDETDASRWTRGYSQETPIYEWKNGEHGDLIRKLFLGYPTKFKASPEGREEIKVNNTILLKFVYKDREELGCENEMKNLLKNFDLEMWHSGSSYYKVNSEYYVVLGQKMCLGGKVATGEAERKDDFVNRNETRRKMKEYLLSPYTEWTFRLTICSNLKAGKDEEQFFMELADKYAHCVDLQLVGCGKSLNENTTGYATPEGINNFYKKVEDGECN